MATQVQNRRGTTAEHSTFTGANGELTVDTTKRTLVVHDGSTAGGRPLLREDQSNLPTSAPTTGIYNASGSLAISTNGTGRLSIDSNGNVNIDSNTLYVDATNNRVGIGTSSVNAPLEVNKTASGLTEIVRLGGTASTTNDGWKLSFYQSTVGEKGYIGSFYDGSAWQTVTNGEIQTIRTGGTERVRVDSSGRVGIGTTSPSANLHVAGQDLYVGSDAVTRIKNDGSLAIISSTYTAGAGYKPLTLWTSDTERARLDTSGRLLVGTSSARTDIGSNQTANIQTESTVNGLGFFTAYNQNNAFGSVLAIAKSRGTTVGSNAIVQSGDQIGGVYFYGADGVDTAVAGSIDCYVDGTPGSNDMPGRLVFSTTADGASSPTERLLISSAGAFRLSNANYLYPNTDNAVGLGFTLQRWSSVWAANGTIQTSDERAKTNITTATLGSDFIKSLRPVSYKWIEGGKRDTGERDENNNYIYESVPGERTHWGFIAQEVKEAVDAAGVDFGGWVLTDKDDPDSQQALRYDQFIAPLTKALQEALAEIDVLKAKVAALESA